jgi:hypothetical protein
MPRIFGARYDSNFKNAELVSAACGAMESAGFPCRKSKKHPIGFAVLESAPRESSDIECSTFRASKPLKIFSELAREDLGISALAAGPDQQK